MIFGFVLCTLFVPGITGAGTTPRWALAAVVLPVLISGARRVNPTEKLNGAAIAPPLTVAHALGLAFIWYAAISVSWSHHWDGLDALVKLVVIAEAFVLGSKLPDLKPVIIGFGLGIWVSSAIILLGIDIPHASDAPAGLFVNSNSLGEIAGLVLVAALFYKGPHVVYISGVSSGRTSLGNSRGSASMWSRARAGFPAPLVWLIPGILPAFIMAQCRGAFVAVAGAGLWWVWQRSKLTAIAIGGAGIAAIVAHGSVGSIQDRLTMWSDILPHLSVMGHGLGSFFTEYPRYSSFDTLLHRPDHLHNDWLEYGFETGAGFALGLAFLWCSRSIVLAALGIEACFGFPTHVAATAILGGIIAGHAVRGRADVRDSLAAWGISLRSRYVVFKACGRGCASTDVSPSVPAEPPFPESIGAVSG